MPAAARSSDGRSELPWNGDGGRVLMPPHLVGSAGPMCVACGVFVRRIADENPGRVGLSTWCAICRDNVAHAEVDG